MCNLQIVHSKTKLEYLKKTRKISSKPSYLKENNCMSCYFTFTELKVIRTHSAKTPYWNFKWDCITFIN